MKAQREFSRMAGSGSKMFLLALGLLLLTPVFPAQADQDYSFANGISVNIVAADEIASQDKALAIELLASNSQYVPFDENQVVAALQAMTGFATEIDVQIFILPAPPAHVQSSYATGNTIYLSPGSGVIAASTQAYIVTHEMGHVLTWAFMDGDADRWDAYMDLRGLDPVTNGPSARHADRAREILAEDFRYLFGGALATASGTIENHDLLLPTHVFGLEELLVGFMAGRDDNDSGFVAACSAFPNPCNPRTTISLSLSGGVRVDASQAQLRVFDLRGALVKTVHGGQQDGDRVLVNWNGDDDNGTTVASGRYLYVLQVGALAAKGSVTLVR